MSRSIKLRGARTHNLKNIDVDVPLGKLCIVCGMSGSGKTSLAIDTFYAEGQRRFIESFSPYTRQFLERMDKPDYDLLEHLPPATAVLKQASAQGNRSTVGSSTEVLDYLRLLYAKIATIQCYQCGCLVEPQTPQTIAARIASIPPHESIVIAFPIAWSDRADLASQMSELQQSGFLRLILANRMVHLARDDRSTWASLIPVAGDGWVAVDRIKGGTSDQRLGDSLETAFQRGDGRLALMIAGGQANEAVGAQQGPGSGIDFVIDGSHYRLEAFSRSLQCVTCGVDYPLPEARLFSFNSPIGACPDCEGLGEISQFDWERIVPDPKKSIREGAIGPWSTPAYVYALEPLLVHSETLKIPIDIPFQQLTERQRSQIMEGIPSKGFEGLRGFFEQLERKKYKMHVRIFIQRWKSYRKCSTCHGSRLKPTSLAYKIHGNSISELCSMEVSIAKEFLTQLKLDSRQQSIGTDILESVVSRLRYLEQVGLGYLTLDRSLRTLSGGESQRVALTAALGSSLTSMLYVLDEPTVGLHPHETKQLVDAILQLRDRGNTLLVVEHEPSLMRKADWVLEIGPHAGAEGGKVTFVGTPDELRQSSCLTGEYLAGKRGHSIGNQRRPTSQGWLKLTGARGNNLKRIDVDFPLGVLCVVTGVSGSGKSSLIQDTLYGALSQSLGGEVVPTLPFDTCSGLEKIDEVVMVDQSPISRSPRSVPVTFIKAFDEIRNVFAATIDATTRNLSASHFSFNHEQGRCPECEGSGLLEIDMQFLADIQMKCPACKGSRFRNEVLSVRFRDRTIAEVLEMTAMQAHPFFRGHSKIQQRLKMLIDIGLGYLRLGQSATTLSSGEGQRLKLASYLITGGKKRTLFLLDEPTTGLHFHDVIRLLDCFSLLLDAGHSLIVVEHNEQMMLGADYIIDLGPGPAEHGGKVVACGTPEEIASNPNSLTGRYLHHQPNRDSRKDQTQG